jgi:hypothetical protein
VLGQLGINQFNLIYVSINNNLKLVSHVIDPVEAQDVATKGYVDNAFKTMLTEYYLVRNLVIVDCYLRYLVMNHNLLRCH